VEEKSEANKKRFPVVVAEIFSTSEGIYPRLFLALYVFYIEVLGGDGNDILSIRVRYGTVDCCYNQHKKIIARSSGKVTGDYLYNFINKS
jgi:hypothetical protein